MRQQIQKTKQNKKQKQKPNPFGFERLIFKLSHPYLTYINPNVIFIIRPVAYGEAQLVLAVHPVEAHFLDKENLLCETPAGEESWEHVKCSENIWFK